MAKTSASKTAEPKSDSRKTIVVEQIGSPIRRPGIQRATLIGLGLNKMHKRRTLVDSPQVRGMVAKISHLVRIVEDEKKA